MLLILSGRNDAYDFWTVDLPTGLIESGNPNAGIENAVIINGPYLMRTAALNGSDLYLTGDINATTTLEVIGAPSFSKLYWNGAAVDYKQSDCNTPTACLEYCKPKYSLPNLGSDCWKTINTLPEIQPGYDDSLWTDASLTYTNNTARNLTTPTSLYSQDYGYNTGTLLYRGRFTASGSDTTLNITTQGGTAYGSSAWLGSDFSTSFLGNSAQSNGTMTVDLSDLTKGKEYIVTVVVDNMGLHENYNIGSSEAKNPRGIINYSLAGRPQTDVTWKLTGNLGGEDVRDPSRGPLNEGGLWVERQGYYLPGAPTSDWADGNPSTGIDHAGVQYYTTTFDLDIPEGYDIPISVSFTNGSTNTSATAFRCQIFVNGYQFGEYVNNIGPQTAFPVPQGIWNYEGSNTLGVTLWALEDGGAKVDDLRLTAGMEVMSGFGKVTNSPMVGWTKREGAY